jgi:hypothetical protein
MAADANPTKTVPGGNLTLWVEFLGPAVAWLCQYELIYAMVPWSCTHGHLLLLRVAWLPFLLASVWLGVLARSHWVRLGGLDESTPGLARSRFMAGLGMMTSAMFGLTILMQGAATYIFHPCQV